jgi:hypothetical protein
MTGLMLVLAMAACGKSGPETTVSVEKANALRFQVVDHDSDYMRRVVAHAGADPSAAGITGQEDVWHAAERVGHDSFLQADDAGAVTGRVRIESYLARLGPSFAVPPGHQIGFEQTAPGTWRSYYLQSAIALDGRAIAASDHDDKLVTIELTDEGRAAVYQLTTRIAGGKLAALSHGEVISAPVVLDRIAGGQLVINTDTEAEAAALAKALD